MPIVYNWIALAAGFLGIAVHFLSQPQTDGLSYFKSIVKYQLRPIGISIIIWVVGWYSWTQGELNTALGFVNLPSLGQPNSIVAFLVGYFGKSLLGHISNLFAGKFGIKAPEPKPEA